MEELNLKNAALVIIDLQKGIASVGRNLAPYSAKEVIDNASMLAEAFRKKGLPVFPVHVAPGEKDRLNVATDESLGSGHGKPSADWTEFVPELNIQKDDIIITKKQWGAFYGTELDLQLRRRKIDTIVLCGIATNYGVESTARFAYEYGYNQIFPEDAMASMSKEAHDASVNFALKRMGRVRTTKDVLDNLK